MFRVLMILDARPLGGEYVYYVEEPRFNDMKDAEQYLQEMKLKEKDRISAIKKWDSNAKSLEFEWTIKNETDLPLKYWG